MTPVPPPPSPRGPPGRPSVVGVVLAAGPGTRLGRPKALVALGERTLLQRAVATLHAAGVADVLAVVGAGGRAAHAAAVAAAARPVVCTEWSSGQSASLRAGLTAAAQGGWDAAVLLLVDQPGVTPEAVRRVLAHVGATPAAVCDDGRRRAPPVLLDRAMWHEVAATASGDRGAGPWLAAHPAAVAVVDVADCADLGDVDTPRDLARARRRVGAQPHGIGET